MQQSIYHKSLIKRWSKPVPTPTEIRACFKSRGQSSPINRSHGLSPSSPTSSLPVRGIKVGPPNTRVWPPNLPRILWRPSMLRRSRSTCPGPSWCSKLRTKVANWLLQKMSLTTLKTSNRRLVTICSMSRATGTSTRPIGSTSIKRRWSSSLSYPLFKD